MNNKVSNALGYTHQIIDVEDVVLKAVALTRRVASHMRPPPHCKKWISIIKVAPQALLRMLK